MKRKIYLLIVLLLCSTLTFAQFKVQGAPHANIAKLARTAVIAEVDFESILFWAGDPDGENQSALVVKWADGKGGDTNLVWGYKWKNGTSPTGETMLRAIAEQDRRFYMLVNGETQYGAAIGGMGFDLNGNGNIKLISGGNSYDLTDGIYDCGDYVFDDFTSNDPDDKWQSGWYNGYWSYWTAKGKNEPFAYASVGASSRVLENGSIDGWSFLADMSNFNGNDMSGTLEYVTVPSEPADYSKGIFFINEGWYGHQNSTVNFLTEDGEWIYRVVQKENPGVELGCTSQYGQIYGDRFYIMSKQEKDPGATITGARLTVCDAKTMKVIKQFKTLGDKGGDGRAFLGVDAHKAYVGTNNGIRVFDLDNLEFTGDVAGSENIGGSSYDELYSAQMGSMIRVNERVFAVHQSKGLLIINPETDVIEQTIKGPEGWGFGSVVLSKDGNLWLSLADASGSGAADTRIMRVDPATLNTELISLPEGIYGPANSWYAWTPDCFCASQQSNVLYWNGGSSSWFSGLTIFKYDIDKNEFSTFIDFNNDADGWQIYGCSFRVSPVGDEAYVSLYKSFGDETYVVRRYGADGKQLAEYPMIKNFWFPALPVFPDNEAPVVNNPKNVELSSEEAIIVPLNDIATDADNFDAAIVKTVNSISNETVLTAQIKDGNLVITPIKNGEAIITIGINSNGKLAEAMLAVSISGVTGIENIMPAEKDGAIRYNLSGQRTHRKGINIVRTSDGKFRKILVK